MDERSEVAIQEHVNIVNMRRAINERSEYAQYERSEYGVI
jgi:hypothetical protein